MVIANPGDEVVEGARVEAVPLEKAPEEFAPKDAGN
jgi:hypothetical protein